MDTRQLLDEMRRLPVQHSVVMRVLGVLDDPNRSACDIAHSLAVDPALCVRVLHLANSPFFGLSGKVGNVEHAAVCLGTSVIRSMVISAAAGVFDERPDDLPEGFLGHSMATAAAASLIAQMTGLSPGDALCAGLLHDIGSALLYRKYRAETIAAWAGPCDGIIEAELKTFGSSHAELGALALEVWRLPTPIVNAIRDHHHDPTTVDSRLTKCLIAAEALVCIVDTDGSRSRECPRDPEAALLAAGLASLDIESMLERISEDSERLAGVSAD